MARRILIAGATGEIGRLLTPALVARGDEVYGLARSPASAELVRTMGARAVAGDALDRSAVLAAVGEARPDVIVHQLTAIPKEVPSPRKFMAMFGPTNRLRREGTRNLVGAASAHGVSRLVAQSIAFAYRPAGPSVVDESAPLDVEADGAWGETVRAVADLEEAVLGFGGVVLRYGSFYGPGTSYAPDGALGSLVMKRRMPVVGGGGGRQPFIHMEDAVGAAMAAIDAAAASGVYNVVDDDPALARDWVPGLAAALGAPTPRRVPAWVARIAAGPDAVRAMTAQRGADNARARADLGWEPSYPGWRAGFPTLLDAA